MSGQAKLQEAEYDFPYHYLPACDDGRVRLYPHWAWGYRYLGGMQLVLDKLRSMRFASLLDVGCGDGRLLRELARAFPRASLRGVDYSFRAIALARALNPELDYRVADIVAEEPRETFDVVTLIEVFEHIDPARADRFIAAVARSMHAGSRLLLTVPHRNEPLNAKHHRHFDAASLLHAVEGSLRVEEFFFFDRRSRLVAAWHRLMCNKYFIIRRQSVTDAFYKYYRKHCLRCAESECLRFGAVLSRR